MGAWGHGIYSNDTALDFLADVIDDAFESAKYNDEFLVVADLIKQNTSATKNQASKIKEVIQEELLDIANWSKNTQEPRKQILMELYQWFDDTGNAR